MEVNKILLEYMEYIIIGEVFKYLVLFFKLYFLYVNNYENVINLFQVIVKKKIEIYLEIYRGIFYRIMYRSKFFF